MSGGGRSLQRPADNHDHRLRTVAPAAAATRHRVDDLLSRRVLTRIKDGSRTLIVRAELERCLQGAS